MKKPAYSAAPISGVPEPKSSWKELFLGRRHGTRYFEACDREETVRILWMECSRFGVLMAYPCVLAETGREPLVFDASRGGAAAEINDRLMERWESLSFPDRRESLAIRQLEEKEFRTIYRQYAYPDLNE